MERKFSESYSFSGDVFPLNLEHRRNSIRWLASKKIGKSEAPKSEKPTTNELTINDDLPKEFVSDGRRYKLNTRFHHMRWVVIFMSGVGMFLVMFSRLSISVAIIDMVNQTHAPNHIHHNIPDHNGSGIIDVLEEVLEDEVAIFDWDNTIQFFLISVYMIAYGIPQAPLSMVIEKKGAHIIGAYTHFIGLISCAMIPLVAHYGWEYVAVCRFILGASHSGIMAIGVHMIEVWFPPGETSLAVTVFQFLSCAGIVFNPLMSGYLTAINWTYAYYVPSFATLIWVILWLVIVRDNPEDCWLISQRELQLILAERVYHKQPVDDDNNINPDNREPWKKVFKLPCFYAILYIWTVHSDDIAENGRLVFIIQLGSLISFLWGVKLLAWLIGRDISKTNARKIVFTISTTIVASAWILPSFIEGSPVWMCLLNRASHPVTEIIIIGTILDNFGTAGISASVFGVANTIGNGATFFFGVLIGRVLDIYDESLTCWHSILLAFSLASVLALICYCVICNSRPIDFDGGKICNHLEQKKGANQAITTKTQHKLQKMNAIESPPEPSYRNCKLNSVEYYENFEPLGV